MVLRVVVCGVVVSCVCVCDLFLFDDKRSVVD